MKFLHTRTAYEVLNTLKAYCEDLHEKTLRKPHWLLLDRLIARETEMSSKWDEWLTFVEYKRYRDYQCRRYMNPL